MSYDIRIIHNGAICEVDEKHHISGGTYVFGGTDLLELNITYNYSPFFCATLGEDGIRSIYGKSIADTLPILERAAAQLIGDPDRDYWAATEGNARKALLDLIALAKMAPPEAVWEGD